MGLIQRLKRACKALFGRQDTLSMKPIEIDLDLLRTFKRPAEDNRSLSYRKSISQRRRWSYWRENR